jgi:Tol biopolymer transport system component
MVNRAGISDRVRILLAAAVLALGSVFGAMGTAEAKVPGDNGAIAFTLSDPGTGDPHTHVVAADGSDGAGLPIDIPDGNARWSPDGSRLVMFTLTDLGLRPGIFHADGSGLDVLAIPGLPSTLDVGPCIWTPAGDRILCRATNFATPDSNFDGIYSIADDGTDPVRLTVNPFPPAGDFGGGDLPGDVSPDGRQFVFMRAKPGPPQSRGHDQSAALFVANIDGSGLRQLTQYGLANSHDESAVSWSPDAKTILFGSARGGLFTIHPDGTKLASVPIRGAGTSTFAAEPNWSPDGRLIVFTLFTRSAGQRDIYTIKADGTALNRLTTTGNVDWPDWGPATD